MILSIQILLVKTIL